MLSDVLIQGGSYENCGNAKTVIKALPKLQAKYGYIPKMFNAYNVSEITTKSPTLSTGSMVTSSCATTIFVPDDNGCYEVEDGVLSYGGQIYTTKIPNGRYILRKLSPTECERLQTLPDGYTAVEGLSDSVRYKAIGNGWTVDVIAYIFGYIKQGDDKNTKEEDANNTE